MAKAHSLCNKPRTCERLFGDSFSDSNHCSTGRGFKSVIASSPHLGTIEMFQQQYTGVIQRDKTEGRATDFLAILLTRSTIAAVELSQSDHGPATSASSMVFVIGSISFSLWARFSDGALRGQHDKPYNRFRPDQQGSQTGVRV